jgi:hypothetical protein
MQEWKVKVRKFGDDSAEILGPGTQRNCRPLGELNSYLEEFAEMAKSSGAELKIAYGRGIPAEYKLKR